MEKCYFWHKQHKILFLYSVLPSDCTAELKQSYLLEKTFSFEGRDKNQGRIGIFYILVFWENKNKENKLAGENAPQISQKHTSSLASSLGPIREVQKQGTKKIPSDICRCRGRTGAPLTKFNSLIISVNNIAFSLAMFTSKIKLKNILPLAWLKLLINYLANCMFSYIILEVSGTISTHKSSHYLYVPLVCKVFETIIDTSKI